MINIILDTCSWIDILKQEPNRGLLEDFQHWSINDEIRLFTHNVILKEWGKHKVDKSEQYKQNIRTKYKNANEILRKEVSGNFQFIEPNYEDVESKLTKIDDLLKNAITLSTTEKVKLLSFDRQLEKKPPFHKKFNSANDALIIFSSLEYFKELNQDFWFISSNYTDFSAESEKDEKLHPSILEDYQSINVTYFSDVGLAGHQLRNKLSSRISLISAGESQLRDQDEITIDSSLSLSEQFIQYILFRKKQFCFTPTHILANHSPLRKAGGLSYYSSFSLVSDHKELLDELKLLIDSASSEQSNDSEDLIVLDKSKTDLNEAIDYLRQNLVYEIHYQGGNRDDKIDIPINSNQIVSAKTSFNNLNFFDGFSLLKQYEGDKSRLLESAYCHYRIGNYLTAEDLLAQVAQTKHDSINSSTQFIAAYNRVKSEVFIHNNYFGKYDTLISELKTLDLRQISKLTSTSSNRKTIEWIIERSFYTETFEKIHELVEKISDHYHSSLNGGWSSNSHIRLLINEYAELSQFLECNNIFYDRFKEFSQLSQLFFKGLFASHAISSKHRSRLESFNDWIVHKMIVYGDADELLKYSKHFDLSKLKYSPSPQKPLKEWVDNFLVEGRKIDEVSSQFLEKGNRAFWDYYNRIFKNLVTVFAILEIDNKELIQFAKKLIGFIKSQSQLHPLSLRFISKFLYRKGEELDTNTLRMFLHLGIEIKDFQQGTFFDAVASSYRLKNKKITISKTKFSQLVKLNFGSPEIPNNLNDPLSCIAIFRFLKQEDQKKIVTDQITETLKNTFHFELYCLSSIFDLIPYKESFFELALKKCIPSEHKNTFKQFWGEPDDGKLSSFDKLLNVAFKFNLDLDPKKLEHFMNYDPYYEWLIDMEKFDYSKFNINWITEYPTKYYAKRIFSSQKTKDKVEECLNVEFDKKVERTYLNIFIRQNWKK